MSDSDETAGSLSSFSRDWTRVVSVRLLGKPRSVRESVLRDLLTDGLPGVVSAIPPGEAGRPVVAEDLLWAEEQLVDASGEVDEAAYTLAHHDVRQGRAGAVAHFCRTGWKELGNPSPRFDLWWYWSEYLDPTLAGTNPLVHYLLLGRRGATSRCRRSSPRRAGGPASCPAGTSGLPVRRLRPERGRRRHGARLPPGAEPVRRRLLPADGHLYQHELAKLAPVTVGAWSVPHGSYDFGSYCLLARDLVGWEAIEGYDELVLANDSGYLLRPLDEVFAEMAGRSCDWWGLQASKHDYHPDEPDAPVLPLARALQTMVGERVMADVEHLHVSSYFLAFRRGLLRDEGFRRRLDSVVAQDAKNLVILKYEIGLSRYLLARGFEMDTFITDLYPFHPLYTKRYFDLLDRGFPLLKRHLLVENSGHVPGLRTWKQRVLAALPEAPVDAIESHLLRAAPDDRLQRSFALESGDRDAVELLRPRNKWEIRDEDRHAPKFDHWWAFVVDPADHTLTGSLRAVFEEVRDDPSLKKVVLTRSARVTVGGENVVVLPFESPDGQRAMARCGYVLVHEGRGEDSLGHFSAARHRRVNLAGAALRRSSWPAAPDGPNVSVPYHAVVVGSWLQGLAVSRAFAPLPAADPWVTGAPRDDLVLAATSSLPDDLQLQQQRLVAELDGRDLVLVASAYDGRGRRSSHAFLDADTTDQLHELCTRQGVVLATTRTRVTGPAGSRAGWPRTPRWISAGSASRSGRSPTGWRGPWSPTTRPGPWTSPRPARTCCWSRATPTTPSSSTTSPRRSRAGSWTGLPTSCQRWPPCSPTARRWSTTPSKRGATCSSSTATGGVPGGSSAGFASMLSSGTPQNRRPTHGVASSSPRPGQTHEAEPDEKRQGSLSGALRS